MPLIFLFLFEDSDCVLFLFFKYMKICSDNIPSMWCYLHLMNRSYLLILCCCFLELLNMH